MTSKRILNARERRKRIAPSEGLLWSILRARKLFGLKFRREHPMGGFIADFACEAKMLVVEIDGGYHDRIEEQDVAREMILRELGWDVVRFTDSDVEQDAEAIGQAIAKHLGLEYSFQRRKGGGSGMRLRRRTGKQSSQPTGPPPPTPKKPETHPPAGGVV